MVVHSEVLSSGPGTGGVRPEVPSPGVSLRIAFFPSLSVQGQSETPGNLQGDEGGTLRQAYAHAGMHTGTRTNRESQGGSSPTSCLHSGLTFALRWKHVRGRVS